MYKSDNIMFRDLNDEEEKNFIKWADNHADEADVGKEGVYHPVIINRWREKGLIK